MALVIRNVSRFVLVLSLLLPQAAILCKPSCAMHPAVPETPVPSAACHAASRPAPHCGNASPLEEAMAKGSSHADCCYLNDSPSAGLRPREISETKARSAAGTVAALADVSSTPESHPAPAARTGASPPGLEAGTVGHRTSPLRI